MTLQAFHVFQNAQSLAASAAWTWAQFNMECKGFVSSTEEKKKHKREHQELQLISNFFTLKLSGAEMHKNDFNGWGLGGQTEHDGCAGHEKLSLERCWASSRDSCYGCNAQLKWAGYWKSPPAFSYFSWEIHWNLERQNISYAEHCLTLIAKIKSLGKCQHFLASDFL